jgi:uncharacterized protein (DUF433 family)
MPKSKIEHRQGPGGTSAYLGSSRVRVSDIARRYDSTFDNVVAERIQQSLPHLTLPEIHAAIDYWRAHPDEIDSEIAEERASLESIPSEV